MGRWGGALVLPLRLDDELHSRVLLMRRRKHHKGRNRHHMLARSRGGNNHVSNLLLMHIERHAAWHKIFGLMTIEEAILLLKRCAAMKGRQKEENDELLPSPCGLSEVRSGGAAHAGRRLELVEDGSELQVPMRSRRRRRVRHYRPR